MGRARIDDAIFVGKSGPTQTLVEEQLVEEFLRCQPSDISEIIDQGSLNTSNLHIRKAIQFMNDHLSKPISIGDVAEAVGTSVRNLQLGFKSETGKSPVQFLREERLQNARAKLLAANSDQRVGDICEQAGFSHFGRFSVAYRNQFGEHPKETLARARL